MNSGPAGGYRRRVFMWTVGPRNTCCREQKLLHIGQIQDQFIFMEQQTGVNVFTCCRDRDVSALTELLVSCKAILFILCWKVPPLWSPPNRDTLCLNDELAWGKQQLRLCVSWTAIQVMTAVLTIARVFLQPIFGCVRRGCLAVISQCRAFCCYFSLY